MSQHSPASIFAPDEPVSNRPVSTGWKKWIEAYIDGCDNPDFKAYVGGKPAADERYIWLVRHLCEIGRMQHARVLDIGCGFGWDAVAIALEADATVLANDIRPEMTSVVEERVKEIRRQGAPVKVETLTGDVCTIALPDNSFDAIVCQEAIEHIHDLDALFRTCFRLLKPGGRAVFTNDNNVFNRSQFAQDQKMWKKRDADWAFIEELKRKRPIENRDIKPYAVMRQEIVLAANPSLEDEEVNRIVDATAGLTAKEIVPLAASYVRGQTLPKPPYASWCRNPITGEYCERQLNPFELAANLAAHGLVTQVRHGFSKRPLSWLNAVHLRWMDILLFNLRAYFIVLGVKPERNPAETAVTRDPSRR